MRVANIWVLRSDNSCPPHYGLLEEAASDISRDSDPVKPCLRELCVLPACTLYLQLNFEALPNKLS